MTAPVRVEVRPCHVVTVPADPPFAVEPTTAEQAEFWTLYAAGTDDLPMAVSDHDTMLAAFGAAADYAAEHALTEPIVVVIDGRAPFTMVRAA